MKDKEGAKQLEEKLRKGYEDKHDELPPWNRAG